MELDNAERMSGESNGSFVLNNNAEVSFGDNAEALMRKQPGNVFERLVVSNTEIELVDVG